jgi:multicomponent Na+:H+ antiporter subunit F
VNVVTDVVFAGLVLSAVLTLLRLLRGPSLADRVISIDVLLLLLVGGIAVQAARTGEAIFVTAAVVAALIAFVATVTVARYIERRGAR